MGVIGWEKFKILNEKVLRKLPKNYPDPSQFLHVLGSSGLTAYFGLYDIGKI